MTATKPFFWASLLKCMVLCITATALLFSCTSTSTKDVKLDGNFYKLRMTKAQYDSLKDVWPSKGDWLVFQFAYDQKNTKNPTLVAYAAKAGHKFENGADPILFKFLEPTSLVSLTLPDTVITGDQQIDFHSIDTEVFGMGASANIIFTPDVYKELKTGKSYIIYRLCKEGLNCPASGLPTQPSPPANAQ